MSENNISKWKNEEFWISPYNFKQEVLEGIRFPERILIHDATLRDGEQTPGVVFRKEEKIEIAKTLDEAGVPRIEAGMPAVSEEDRQAIEEIAKSDLNAKIYSFARADPRDMVLCTECGSDGVIIELAIGKPKMTMQMKYDIQTALEKSLKAIETAKEHGLNAVLFPYDATRCEEEDLLYYLDGLKKYGLPDSIGIVDTMGCASPEAIAFMTRLYKEKLQIPIEIHVHNDFGMGLYASIAALQAGAEVVHGCVNGLGERTGNVPTEEIAATLQIIYAKDCGVDIKKLIEASHLVEKLSKYPVASKKPVIGRGNFIRESGVGADLVIKNPLAMFAVDPAFYSQKGSVVMGKKSGLLSVELKLSEMGITAERDAMKKILAEVKAKGIEAKRLLTDEEFAQIVSSYI